MKYEILVKDTYDETSDIKETELVTTCMNSDGKTNDPSKRCTSKGCTNVSNNFMLTCLKCKEPQHFSCSGLPDYQITLFMTKGYRNFVCKLCVGMIPQEISNNCS